MSAFVYCEGCSGHECSPEKGCAYPKAAAPVREAAAPHWTDLVEIAPGVQGLRRKSSSATPEAPAMPDPTPRVIEGEPVAWQQRGRMDDGRWTYWFDIGDIDGFRERESVKIKNGTVELRPLFTASPSAALIAERDEALYSRDEHKRVIEDWQKLCGKYRDELATAEAEIAALKSALDGAARDVLAERQRQVEKEGWTPEHDDCHDDYEMALAAVAYLLAASAGQAERAVMDEFRGVSDTPASILQFWPWDRKWWKPSSRRRDLIKAGAMILAEIERLDRAALQKDTGNG